MREILKRYRSQLVKESILKAALYAAIAAFAAVAISAIAFWMADFRMVWLLAVIFGGVLLIVTPVLYFACFRPTEKIVAKRLDKEFKLDERMLTMLEYQGSDAILACAQRANAISLLKSAQGKKITLAVASAAVVAALAVAFTVGAGMTTVSALSANGVIPSGKELLSGGPVVPKVYTVTYEVEGTGEIRGTLVQEVTEGENASSVWAVPGTSQTEEGELIEWYFVGWSDGVTNPYRMDMNITSDMTITAIFAEVGGDNFTGDSDAPTDLPTVEGEPGGEGSGDNGGNGWPSRDPGSADGSGGEGDGAGGMEQENGMINDGDTWYGSDYNGSSQDAQDAISGNSNLNQGEKDFILGYGGGLNPGSGGGNP